MFEVVTKVYKEVDDGVKRNMVIKIRTFIFYKFLIVIILFRLKKTFYEYNGVG